MTWKAPKRENMPKFITKISKSSKEASYPVVFVWLEKWLAFRASWTKLGIIRCPCIAFTKCIRISTVRTRGTGQQRLRPSNKAIPFLLFSLAYMKYIPCFTCFFQRYDWRRRRARKTKTILQNSCKGSCHNDSYLPWQLYSQLKEKNWLLSLSGVIARGEIRRRMSTTCRLLKNSSRIDFKTKACVGLLYHRRQAPFDYKFISFWPIITGHRPLFIVQNR